MDHELVIDFTDASAQAFNVKLSDLFTQIIPNFEVRDRLKYFSSVKIKCNLNMTSSMDSSILLQLKDKHNTKTKNGAFIKVINSSKQSMNNYLSKHHKINAKQQQKCLLLNGKPPQPMSPTNMNINMNSKHNNKKNRTFVKGKKMCEEVFESKDYITSNNNSNENKDNSNDESLPQLKTTLPPPKYKKKAPQIVQNVETLPSIPKPNANPNKNVASNGSNNKPLMSEEMDQKDNKSSVANGTLPPPSYAEVIANDEKQKENVADHHETADVDDGNTNGSDKSDMEFDDNQRILNEHSNVVYQRMPTDDGSKTQGNVNINHEQDIMDQMYAKELQDRLDAEERLSSNRKNRHDRFGLSEEEFLMQRAFLSNLQDNNSHRLHSGDDDDDNGNNEEKSNESKENNETNATEIDEDYALAMQLQAEEQYDDHKIAMRLQKEEQVQRRVDNARMRYETPRHGMEMNDNEFNEGFVNRRAQEWMLMSARRQSGNRHRMIIGDDDDDDGSMLPTFATFPGMMHMMGHHRVDDGWRNLPTRVLKEKDVNILQKSDEKKECAICKSDFMIDDETRQLPCFHEFHKNCVDQWFQQQNKKGTEASCPLDRRKVNDNQ